MDGTKTIDVSIPIKVQGNATNNNINLLQMHNVTIEIQYQLSLVTSRQPITQSGLFKGTKILKINSPSTSSNNKAVYNLNRMAFSALIGFFFLLLSGIYIMIKNPKYIIKPHKKYKNFNKRNSKRYR